MITPSDSSCCDTQHQVSASRCCVPELCLTTSASALQTWVRPKPRGGQPRPAERAAEGSSSLVLDASAGVHGPPPAVPLHDSLEDQLMVDSALDRVEQGRHSRRAATPVHHQE